MVEAIDVGRRIKAEARHVQFLFCNFAVDV